MTVETEDLEQIVQMVWETLLDMPVYAGLPEQADDSRSAGAQVKIGGASEGWVRLECSPALGRRITARLLMTSEDDLDQASVDDALRELVNIIGGNIKALLPEPSRLGIPEALSPPGPGTLILALDCESEPMVIGLEILERHLTPI
jgi:chemotaxis protein CheX